MANRRILPLWAMLAGIVLSIPSWAEIPAETVITIRLLTPVSSYGSKPGDKVQALVIPSVNPSHPSELPVGTIVDGSIKGVRRVGLGLVHEKAELQLDFRVLSLPGGSKYFINTRVVSVDNARENVDRNGKIHGIRATSSLSNRVGSRLIFVDRILWPSGHLVHPVFWIPIFAAETAVFHFPDPEINFATGTELGIKLEQPLLLPDPGPAQTSNDAPGSGEHSGLQALVSGMPEWSYSRRERMPMDPITLAFVGSGDEIQRTFAAAGWTGARPLSWVAGTDEVRAIMVGQAYADGPMRTLMVGNAAPDFSFQKTLDTFQKRDHLRLWKSPETWQGQAVWASAATRDVSASFSVHPIGFTHRVESDVTLERDTVVNDLFFTGCVDSVAYLHRPQASNPAAIESRKGVTTDQEIAVISLNSCTTPRYDFSTPMRKLGPGVSVRVLRRITLTARNHILRDNLIWRTGEVVRITYASVKRRRYEGREQPMAKNQPGLGIGASLASARSAPLLDMEFQAPAPVAPK
jgi:hypothetical protein